MKAKKEDVEMVVAVAVDVAVEAVVVVVEGVEVAAVVRVIWAKV